MLQAGRPSRFRREFIPLLERLGLLLREAGLPEEAVGVEHEAAGLRGQGGQ